MPPADDFDSAKHPGSLSEAACVEQVDRLPIILDRLDWSGRCLLIDPPLKLVPILDEESGHFYVLFDLELGIDVFAQTREELAEELAEQLWFQWDTYALESPEKLTAGARVLRQALLNRMREGQIASRA